MAVTDVAPLTGSPASGRPGWGHLIRCAVLAALILWGVEILLLLVTGVLPGSLDAVVARVVPGDGAWRPFVDGGGWEAAGHAGVAIVAAVVMALALWWPLRSRQDERASLFWVLIAAALGTGTQLYLADDGSFSVALAVACVAARYLAFDGDGRRVPSPLRPGPVPGRLLGATVALAIGAVVVAAVVDPLVMVSSVERSPLISLDNSERGPVLTTGLENRSPRTVHVVAVRGPGVKGLLSARAGLVARPGQRVDLDLRPACARLRAGRSIPVRLRFAGGDSQELVLPAVGHGCR